jgi:hypothetical protein
MLFLSFRSLYQSFRAGSITKNQAHKEKLKLLKTYGDKKSTPRKAHFKDRLVFIHALKNNHCNIPGGLLWAGKEPCRACHIQHK